jgi:hypothetical protein
MLHPFDKGREHGVAGLDDVAEFVDGGARWENVGVGDG